jgi:hypothetical protein
VGDWRFRGAFGLHHKALTALMMEAARVSETSVTNQTTWRSIPGDSHLLTRRLEKLKWNLTSGNLFSLLRAFYPSALDRGQSSESRSGRFTPGDRKLGG